MTGCVAEDVDLGSTEQELQYGTQITRATQEAYGAVFVNGNASGVMLDNSIGLSAGHVIERNPANVWVVKDTKHRASLTYTFSAADLALFHLDNPISLRGSRTGFVNTIGDVTVGERVDVVGQGHTAEAGGGDGVMRRGFMEVTAVGTPDPVYTVMLADPTRILAGDSGGPTFADGQLVGVHGMADYGCTTNCYGYDLTLFPKFWGIVAASEKWTDDSTNVFNMMEAEILANSEEVRDLETDHWFDLARIANEMCTNRSNMLSGHFTGTTIPGRYGVSCTAKDYDEVTVFQLSPIQRTAAGWGAIHFASLGWAANNRLARNACENLGIRAGYLTGDTDWRLVCHQGAKRYDVTREELEDMGHPIRDIDDVTYAQSMRAATAFCTKQTTRRLFKDVYGKSGFFTGYRTDTGYEVYCEF